VTLAEDTYSAHGVKPRRYAEASLQVQVCHHLKLRHRPGVFWFHVPNGANRSPAQSALLKKMGLLPGMADLVVIVAGRAHFLELKASGGRPSVDQIAFQALCQRLGACPVSVFQSAG
jgi:hypothetical protein